jgi:predicted nucleic acid-binding protein
MLYPYIFKRDTRAADFIVYPSDNALCLEWAAVRAESHASGTAIQTADTWVAATVRLNKLPLVTNNVKDFQHVAGLRLLIPEARQQLEVDVEPFL